MRTKKKTKERDEVLQWHPAFYAGIQIEFDSESKYLSFRQEYPLGTKPKQIDVLIKNEDGVKIQKNIGRIFRKHNVIEYKGPGDYLSIDTYYKVYGYTCFYKSNTGRVNAVRFEEITISLVSESYPQELIWHLEKERKLQVQRIESGIYYVLGEAFPVQIIVTRMLSEKENMWLRCLTNRLGTIDEAEKLLEEYKKHKHDERYESVMEIIVRANEGKFEEVKIMCKALEELMKEELEAKRTEGEESGKEIGKEIGKQEGETRVNELNLKLSELGRIEDVVKAASDRVYQEKLFEEFGL